FFKITLIHLTVVIAFWVLVKGYYYSCGHLILSTGIMLVLGVSWRVLATNFIKQYRLLGYNKRHYIIIAYGELSETINNYYGLNPGIGYVFKGYFDQKAVGNNIYPFSEDLTGLEEFLMDEQIDHI